MAQVDGSGTAAIVMVYEPACRHLSAFNPIIVNDAMNFIR